MTTRTPERIAFLRDIFTTAIEGGINGWATVESYHIWVDPSAASSELVAREDPTAEIKTYDEEKTYDVDIDLIARGINMVVDGTVEYFNNGYNETSKRIALLNRTNGADGDYDAIDADCILQLGIWGEIVY